MARADRPRFIAVERVLPRRSIVVDGSEYEVVWDGTRTTTVVAVATEDAHG